jgi:menaquinone-dependent protoporphyrinogen oxidase
MNNNRILVTYASRTGCAAEIAEVIGKTMVQGGAQVDVLPMQDVKDLSLYRVVVAGSAIRKSKWLPEAMQFVQTHRSELAQMPFATFTVCITLAVTKWIQPVRTQVSPVSEDLFAGRLDFSKLPLTFDTLLLRAVVVFGIFPKGDRRDWKSIRAWADGLHRMLLQ